ncbi:MAG: hypothetical protein ABIV50_04045 [Opitutus sp.]
MRLLFSLCLLALAVTVSATEEPLITRAAARTTVEAALKTFRTEGPKGWSFIQTTSGDGHSRVERYDGFQPEFNRWTLLKENDQPPTEAELNDYKEKLSRRSRGGTAPQLTDQVDLSTLEVTGQSSDHVTCQARLKPGEKGDRTAAFLRATLVIHTPTHTIESFELSADQPFSPTWGVNITAMRTTLRYSLPDGARPSLLQQSSTQLRGRAFYFKSLDADMSVTFTDYERAHR